MYFFDPVLIGIIIFGFITSYTDIKEGKIKNSAIILLLIYGLFVNLFVTKTLTNFSTELRSDFIQTIANFLITLIFGFLMWTAGLLSPGDAKLFLGYSFLIPIFTYKNGYISLFPSLVILINSFLPLTIFYILKSITRVDFKTTKEGIKRIFTIHSFLSIILTIFGLFYVLQLILIYFGVEINYLLQIFLLFILYESLKKISGNFLNVFSAIGSLGRLFLSFSSISNLSFIKEFLISILLFQILRLIFNYFIDLSFTESVKIKDLKTGMILGEYFIKERDSFKKKDITLINMFGLFDSIKEGIFKNKINRLTGQDIKELKRLSKKGKLDFGTLKIAKTISFAPIIFIGSTVTYLIKGSIIYYFLLLLR